jgi:trk system potassium uptake protein TrkA
MKVVIIGCGRVGSATAVALDTRGETVSVIDVNQQAFERLPLTFAGSTIRGSGTDEDVLRSAGAETADVVMALTEGDNRNVLAAQMAKHVFGVPRVIAKVNDPLRAGAYRTLGLETICRTNILSEALVTAAAEGAAATNGMVEEPTAHPMRGAPSAARSESSPAAQVPASASESGVPAPAEEG